jgi:MFS transporter, DHA2 family, triacylglyceride efflux pump
MMTVMGRLPRLALLAALGGGVFVSGLELMITATALPSIVVGLADWTRLREASWIINGYLVAYVAMMPLAGRLADRFGVVGPYLIALTVFAVGSALSGAAQSLEGLIAARVLQGLGGGALIPLATSGASHLFEGRARARALGLVGGLTFLGMATGPFAGAAILGIGDLRPAFEAAGLPAWLVSVTTPAWRWVFYLDVPAALLALTYVWAAAPAWDAPRTRTALHVPALALFTAGLAGSLLALTWAGDAGAPGGAQGQLALAVGSVVALALSLTVGAIVRDPLLDPRRYLERVLGGAVAVSALTGYALATALIGGAVFVDRVLYGGPPDQRVALGALAAAMAVGALVSGLILGRLGVVTTSLGGLVVSALGLGALGLTTRFTPLDELAAWLALFGLGFGLTVSPRSMAAVEAAGRASFGVASGAVTLARMLGMAVGLAVLTAFGSGKIEALSRAVQDQAYRDSVLPAALRGRPLADGLVVDALERWAASQGAAILDGLFLVAGVVILVAIVPALAMKARPARAPAEQSIPAAAARAQGGQDVDVTRTG